MNTPDEPKDPKHHTEPKSTTDSAEAAQYAHFSEWLAGPVERLEHDVNLEHVTNDGYWAAENFIRACEGVAVWRLMQGELSGDAGHHIHFLARALAHSVRVLIERGDVMLARQLPPIVEELQRAMQQFGPKITGRVSKRLSIDQILKKHRARELLAMLSALHPDWHVVVLHIYHRQIRQLPEDKRHAILLRKRRIIESFPEERLEALLLSEERFEGWKDGQRYEERRKHGIAEIIENIIAMRDAENENINLFIEHLWRGRLWSLGPDKSGTTPGKTWVAAPWQAKKKLPKRNNVRAWLKIVMPFLKEVTGGDAMRLDVFEHMLAARRFVYHDASGLGHGRLATDSPKAIWNQVETEIRKAWGTMAKRTVKPKARKVA